ncbi:methyl-accepting chemotaxis sensory transducer [Sphaerotilus hippei]|uniref:Methyl-accepting chemotaxis sensory transducer n=2 Tax=Sphaerotilus hippei TaxID=744406 RepID=A0A318GYW8_9BURK|nr:methyl-accepting chemotaxis sensory transducer [Sphaerotilus hippei]
MNQFRSMRLGARLGSGFGLVLMMMVIMVGAALWSMTRISTLAHRVVEQDMVKAKAAATLNETVQANGLITAKMIFAGDSNERSELRAQMDRNKQTVDESLKTLERLVYLAKGKALLAELVVSRQAFVAAFSQTLVLLDGGDRAGAESHMKAATLPALAVLQKHAHAVLDLQDELAKSALTQVIGQVDGQREWMMGLGVMALMTGGLCAWWLTRSITRPIAQAVRVARTVAAGDLTSSIEVQGRDELAELLEALRDMNASLVGIVGQVRASSESIATGSSQIAMGNADLSQRTEEQASNLQQTAASMEQLSSTVTQNAETARQANQLALGASDAVRSGGQMVGEVVQTMGVIQASSQRINDIIGVIDGIAFQTNILALNAAVEAARAGEQGRGFAVVAAEVRALAQRSAEAAREIKGLITASVEQVSVGSHQVVSAGQRMEVIVTQVQRVADLVSEITSASAEQSQGIEQVGDAVNQLDQVTQQNAALVEESAAAAESLRQQAHQLARVVQGFKLAVC